MKEINNYILEKLKLNKDVNLKDNSLYLIHPKNEIYKYIQNNYNYKHYLFSFTEDGLYYGIFYKNEIIDICKKCNYKKDYLNIFKIINPSLLNKSRKEIINKLENSKNSPYNNEDFEYIYKIDDFLNESILEKLKIDKDSEIKNPYKDIPLDVTLSHIMGDFMRQTIKITMYDISKSDKDEITIEMNKDAGALIYQEIKYKLNELKDFYNIKDIKIDTTGSNYIIKIKYEESK